MQDGRSGICPPVHRIDSHTGSCDERLDVSHIFHCIVTDGNTCVCLSLCRLDVLGLQRVLWRYLIAQNISGSQLTVSLVVDMLQQLNYCQTSLTEACDDERARLVTLGLKKVESLADIAVVWR